MLSEFSATRCLQTFGTGRPPQREAVGSGLLKVEAGFIALAAAWGGWGGGQSTLDNRDAEGSN